MAYVKLILVLIILLILIDFLYAKIQSNLSIIWYIKYFILKSFKLRPKILLILCSALKHKVISQKCNVGSLLISTRIIHTRTRASLHKKKIQYSKIELKCFITIIIITDVTTIYKRIYTKRNQSKER